MKKDFQIPIFTRLRDLQDSGRIPLTKPEDIEGRIRYLQDYYHRAEEALAAAIRAGKVKRRPNRRLEPTTINCFQADKILEENGIENRQFRV